MNLEFEEFPEIEELLPNLDLASKPLNTLLLVLINHITNTKHS